jgi:Trk-type K+ transport system membrane component
MMTAVIGTIRGKNEFTLGRRSIHISLVYKAFAVVIFSGLLVLLFITLLSFTEPHLPLINIAFETVSAFATVGLSTGITANLSDISKVILVVAMFVGRVGIITLAFSLSTREDKADFRYTQTHLMIG